ncbi:MAG: histidine kinase [Clostridiales bacterium]|jgi:sensor histidine kinase YesM|nr:histidine kinase [Clostridiales bacterium]
MKKRNKLKSIQSTLFVTYFYILITVLIILMSFFIFSEARKIRGNAFLLLTQNTNTISSYIENEVKTLDTVAQNIAYSNLIKERFANYISISEDSPIQNKNTANSNNQNTKTLIDMLSAILGPSQPVVQIYLYSLDRGVFGVGLDTSTSTRAAKESAWYQSFISSPHYKLLSCNKDGRLEGFYSYGATFISLYIMYYNVYNIPQGIIEVKNPISSMNRKIKDIATTYNESIYIFDPNGNPLYPDFSDTKDNKYFASIQERASLDTSNDVVTYKFDKDTNLFYKTSASTGFTVAIAVENSSLFRPVYEYIRVNIILLLIIAVAMLLLSYIAARIIATPISKLYKQAQSFSINPSKANNYIFTDIDTHIIEFNTLYSALVAMQQKAQQFMEREITLQSQEMQSRMLALQSQMNPHFLYNSLATIQSMADEHMYEEIHLMCQNISSILRYISSGKELLVPLKLETELTLKYLNCMKTRFDDDLIYYIEIPDEMMGVKIPKLCLQLIVENSIKFTTKATKPPWKVWIAGTITDTHWELAISDNGPGFSQAQIDALNEKILEVNKTGLMPNLEINGMGLLNIYIRFKLLYKGSHIFRIGNLEQSGALLTIGGKIDG